MPEPYIGEIRIWSFHWAPRGWALCDGSLLPIQQYNALYALLGTRFGGDGRSTFGLPDLRGRTPIGVGRLSTESLNYALGDHGGQETTTLSIATVPAHAHRLTAYPTNANKQPPFGLALASVGSVVPNSPTNFSTFLPESTWTPNAQLNPATISTTGASTPHENMQPFSVVNFTICVVGIYPPRPLASTFDAVET